jgi:hypothetical protein
MQMAVKEALLDFLRLDSMKSNLGFVVFVPFKLPLHYALNPLALYRSLV